MKRKIPPLFPLLKRNFFAGVLIIIPFGVIIWILFSVLEGLWSLHEILPTGWRPENIFQDATFAAFVNLGITLATTFLLTLGVSILGWASKQYLGGKILQVAAEIIQRIPVIRGIYSALDQLLRTLASQDGNQFNRVVYVEYPRKDVWTLAFVTSSTQGFGTEGGTGKFLHIYVPTTPNPTSGFYLIVPENDVRESGLSVEEAFKTILSLGIAQTPGSAAGTPK
ncbi:DUF502 domain-containing protein [Bdellovibrionota bacterium FG-2]